ncbi:MAG: glycosyltransferase, partial [Proteobacteria bacterium]|nr:glycosyltransferase [Pseudomonadota bacterium]
LTPFANILIDPPVAESRLFLARSRVLLVPSVFQEPFGTIAAEAMLNGIPPVVSNRGGLPDTVGDAGVILPLPERFDEACRVTPDRSELQPWFDAVCRLWDDAAFYERTSRRVAATGQELYRVDILRQRYLDYIESMGASPASDRPHI